MINLRQPNFTVGGNLGVGLPRLARDDKAKEISAMHKKFSRTRSFCLGFVLPNYLQSRRSIGLLIPRTCAP